MAKTKRKKPRWQWWTKKRLKEVATDKVMSRLTTQEHRKLSKKEFAEKVSKEEYRLVANWKLGRDDGTKIWDGELQLFVHYSMPKFPWNQL